MNRTKTDLAQQFCLPAISNLLACSLCLLVLPACHIPELRQAEPSANLPADFGGKPDTDSFTSQAALLGGVAFINAPTTKPATAENSGCTSVEQFYDDPALLNLFRQAVANNQELKIRTEEIQISNYEILSRIGAYLPFLSLGTKIGVEKTSRYTREGAVERSLEFTRGKRFPEPYGHFMIGAEFSWQVDIWRKLHNARDAAALRYFATSEGRNFIVTRLVAEIAENYYSLLALDKRLEILDLTLEIQQRSQEISEARREAGRGTALPVQRFLAEVRKNQSEKLIVKQEIIETENRINFLVGRYPQPVERQTKEFLDLNMQTLSVGIPAQLLLNRPDIRQAERELQANGLDVLVARAEFLPSLDITGGIGWEAFSPRYLFNPGAFIANAAGGFVGPLVNKKAIQAAYGSANAAQLQSVYNYQRIVLNAFTEVVNQVSREENYRKSLEIKRQQLKALENSVETASNLYQRGRAEYSEVLFAQRDLLEARTVVIDTKREQLSAIVNTYQALGGGNLSPTPTGITAPVPIVAADDRGFAPPATALRR